MKTQKTGFAVIYQWRLHKGLEEQFQLAWATTTELFMAERGALGSRLHRAAALMTEATTEAFEPILLDPVQDYLVGG